MKICKHQLGISIIEFTLVVTALMLIIFSVIEVGRFVYSQQIINEITRKAARLGVVCYVLDKSDIANIVITDNAPVGFTSDNLIIEYLNSSGGVVDDPETNFSSIKSVLARSSGYNFKFMGFLSFFGSDGEVEMPEFKTVLPIETLGVIRRTLSHPEDRKTDC